MTSSRFKNFEDVNLFLEAIPKFSHTGAAAAHFGLDHMEKFCERLGDPQNSLRAIHVAGTNGKGTTCQMLASIFQEAGCKTGLYTSPHLTEYNERIRVNGRKIPDKEILAFFIDAEDALDDIPLTYFELSTCLAFWYFARTGCDIVLVETGLGGRLDATNIIDPVASVITSISLDHTDILGNSIREIAAEKAGIIKPGKPAITGNLCGEALEVIREKSGELGSPLYRSSDFRPVWKSDTVELMHPDTKEIIRIDGSGRKQVDRLNIATSLAVIRAIQQLPQRSKYRLKVDMHPMNMMAFQKVDTVQITGGIEKVDERYPEHAHFQQLHPDRRWYFDGAHNQEAMTTLFEHLSVSGGNEEPVFFLSLMKDKVSRELMENFRPYKYVHYIERGIERHASCDQVRSILPQVICVNSDSPEVERILNRLKSELVIFAGSFYFYQQVKHWMASQPPSDHMKHSGLRP